MTYEEFEEMLNSIKKSSRPEVLDYIEKVKCSEKPYKEDVDNNTIFLNSTDTILKENANIDKYLDNTLVGNIATTVALGGLAIVATPVIAVFSSDIAMNYAKAVLGISVGSIGFASGLNAVSRKLHEWEYTRKLKKECKLHIKNEFSNQVRRSVEIESENTL